MKCALVIAELPSTKDANEDRRRWLDFLEHVRRLEPHPKNTIRLTGNVWQIPLDTGLPFLGQLIHLGQENGISMRALLLDEPPTWITHPPAN